MVNRLQEALEGTRDRESPLAERVAASVVTAIAHHTLSCIRFMDHPLLGRSALQLIENQFAMLLECGEALFERIEQ